MDVSSAERGGPRITYGGAMSEQPGTQEISHLTLEERLDLRHGAERLETEFAELLSRETIDEYIHSSYVHLAASARIKRFVPLLAERFARQRLRALLVVEGRHESGVPTVIFVDEHNAGRSQIAMAYLDRLAGERVASWSGGREPAPAIFPDVVTAMQEVGISLRDEFPKHWTSEVLAAADLIVTMGPQLSPQESGSTPVEVWDVKNPGVTDLDGVRAIRDDLRARVEGLVAGDLAKAMELGRKPLQTPATA